MALFSRLGPSVMLACLRKKKNLAVVATPQKAPHRGFQLLQVDPACEGRGARGDAYLCRR